MTIPFFDQKNNDSLPQVCLVLKTNFQGLDDDLKYSIEVIDDNERMTDLEQVENQVKQFNLTVIKDCLIANESAKKIDTDRKILSIGNAINTEYFSKSKNTSNHYSFNSLGRSILFKLNTIAKFINRLH